MELEILLLAKKVEKELQELRELLKDFEFTLSEENITQYE